MTWYPQATFSFIQENTVRAQKIVRAAGKEVSKRGDESKEQRERAHLTKRPKLHGQEGTHTVSFLPMHLGFLAWFRVTAAVMEHSDQKQLGEARVDFTYSVLPFITSRVGT